MSDPVTTVVELTTLQHIARHRDELNDVVNQSANGTFLETPEWLMAWINGFQTPPFHLLMVREGARLSGFATLLGHGPGHLWCRRALATPLHGHVPRANVVARAGEERVVHLAILEYARAQWPGLAIAFTSLDTGGPAYDHAIDAIRTTGRRPVAFEGPTMPWIRLEGSYGAYLGNRSSHHRTQQRRKRAKFERAGSAMYRTVTEASEVDDALQDVLTIERRSWKASAGSDFEHDGGAAAFYTTFAHEAAKTSRLRLHLLYLDGTPVAHVYGVVHRSTFYALKTSYDRSFAALSPGVVLFDHAIRDAFSRAFSAFEFLGVDAPWKHMLATDAHVFVHVCAADPRSVRCATCSLYQARVKPFVRANAQPLLALRRRLRSR